VNTYYPLEVSLKSVMDRRKAKKSTHQRRYTYTVLFIFFKIYLKSLHFSVDTNSSSHVWVSYKNMLQKHRKRGPVLGGPWSHLLRNKLGY
jgi:hypothetical protein